VGAYEYNAFAGNPCCGAFVRWRCTTKRWDIGGCEGMKFRDPAWRHTATLRRDFEHALNSGKMDEVIRTVPKECTCCCGVCGNPEKISDQINQHWCPDVNRSLLNPAGYHCDAFYWCTKGHNGEAEHHMVMRIVKVTKLEAELHASYS